MEKRINYTRKIGIDGKRLIPTKSQLSRAKDEYIRAWIKANKALQNAIVDEIHAYNKANPKRKPKVAPIVPR